MRDRCLFRGQIIDNNEWIYGYYVKLHNDKDKNILHRIYTGSSEKECDEYYEDYDEVILETVGQFINRLDKKDVQIFEGDICILTLSIKFSISEVGVVEYLDDRYILRTSKDSYREFMFIQSKDVEVIGNIFDNPELLNEVGEEEND